jgi:hypothetical protein
MKIEHHQFPLVLLILLCQRQRKLIFSEEHNEFIHIAWQWRHSYHEPIQAIGQRVSFLLL